MAEMDVLVTIAPAIAKAIYKSIGREPFLAEIADDLYTGIADRGLEYIRLRKSARQVESLAEDITGVLLAHLQRDGSSLARQERIAVLLTIYETLCRDDIDDAHLEEAGYDPTQLESYLEGPVQRRLGLLSDGELRLFRRLLREVCGRIIRIGVQIRFFDDCPILETPEGKERILSIIAVDGLLADAESEKMASHYLKDVVAKLDGIEFFGVQEGDEKHPRRTPITSFVPPLLTRRAALPVVRERPSAATNGEQEAISMECLLESAWRMVIVGGAGSGKTSLMRWLAVRASRRDMPRSLRRLNEAVPFFVRLRSSTEHGLPGPDQAAAMIAEAISGALPEHLIQRYLESGRALLLLDGLDEFPPARRDALLERLRQLVSAFPLVRWVITSRPTALAPENWPEWRAWTAAEGFQTAEIRPLADQQVRSLIENWHRAFEKTLDDPTDRQVLRRIEGSLVELLQSRPALRRLAGNPLMCAMICALHHERGDRIPMERSKLYEGCTMSLLDRHDIEQHNRPEIDLGEISMDARVHLLECFADWMMRNGLSEATILQADRRFTELVKGLTTTRAINGTTVRISFVEAGALLRETLSGRIEFIHRTFQEYLAARHIAREEKIDQILEHAEDDQWWGTIVFTANMLDVDKRNLLLGKLLERAKPPRRLFRRPEPSEYDRRLVNLASAVVESGVEVDPAVQEILEAATGPVASAVAGVTATMA